MSELNRDASMESAGDPSQQSEALMAQAVGLLGDAATGGIALDEIEESERYLEERDKVDPGDRGEASGNPYELSDDAAVLDISAEGMVPPTEAALGAQCTLPNLFLLFSC